MTATSFFELKQKLTRVSEAERKELSVFLIRRGQERPAWKKDTARRLAAMAAGQQVSVFALRSQLGHG